MPDSQFLRLQRHSAATAPRGHLTPPGKGPRGGRHTAAPIPCCQVSQSVWDACGVRLGPRGDLSRELATEGMRRDSGAALDQDLAKARVGGDCGARRRGGGDRPPLPACYRRKRAPCDHARARGAPVPARPGHRGTLECYRVLLRNSPCVCSRRSRKPLIRQRSI